MNIFVIIAEFFSAGKYFSKMRNFIQFSKNCVLGFKVWRNISSNESIIIRVVFGRKSLTQARIMSWENASTFLAPTSWRGLRIFDGPPPRECRWGGGQGDMLSHISKVGENVWFVLIRDIARKIGKSGEPWYICNRMSFTRPFLLGTEFFWTALPCSGGYHMEGDELTWWGWD